MSGRINSPISTSRTQSPPRQPSRSPSPPPQDQNNRTLDPSEYRIELVDRHGDGNLTPVYIITNPKQPIVCGSSGGPVGIGE